MKARFTGWSSATRMSSGGRVPSLASFSGRAAGQAAAGASATKSGSLRVNRLPWPGLLQTSMSPPISRARPREISRPRPVPP